MNATHSVELDTLNKYMVAAGGDGVAIMHPPTRADRLTKADALGLAAWLVAMTEWLPGPDFPVYLEAVKAT